MNKKKWIKMVLVVLVGVVFFVLFYFIGTQLENQKGNDTYELIENEGISYIDNREVIEISGNQYALKRGISTYLIAGVDKESFDDENSQSRSQADFIALIVADHNAEKLYRISIDRDTMTDITVVSLLGKPKGTRNAQIALSYAYGTEPKASAQFLVSAVENLFKGIIIDHYFILPMNAVTALNEAVGGVKVHISEDMTSVDPQFVSGREVVLQGDQAIKFIRARKDVGEGLNTSRIDRQNTFIKAFFDKVASIVSDDKTATKTIVDKIFPMIDCNAKKGEIINAINRIMCYNKQDHTLLEGVRQISKSNNMEFYLDESHLVDILLTIFYERIG